MRHAALAEEAFLAREAAVDELVHDDEMPGRQVFLQAADSGERNHVRAAGPLQRVDIGAIIQVAGREPVAAAVARQEHAAHAVEHAMQEFIGRRRPRATGCRAPLALFQALDVIEAGAADYADDSH